ncbi:MAG: AzlD domain-containing protein [Pseudolabrys sp.]|nr:AzlD domain-containing protein [Pseudolabrys sp.]
MIDVMTPGVWAAIAAMAVVTVGIRVSGFWLMGYVPLTRRVRATLNALPGAVIVAIILPLAVRGGFAAGIAILFSVAIMAWRRNDLLALVCGCAAAALVRATL